MILPEGHWRAVAAPRHLRSREKWIIRSVLGLVAVGVIAVVIALFSGARTSGKGCIDVMVPGPTGATELYRCGAQARAVCSSLPATAAYTGSYGRAAEAACRKAGIPSS